MAVAHDPGIDGTITGKSSTRAGDGKFFVAYSTDTESDPVETGIGKVFVTGGEIQDDVSAPILSLDVPDLIAPGVGSWPIDSTVEINVIPKITFIDESRGLIVLGATDNSVPSSPMNATMVFWTEDAFATAPTFHTYTWTAENLMSATAFELADSVYVGWIEGVHAVQSASVDFTTSPPIFGVVENVYADRAITSLDGFAHNGRPHYLFQTGESDIPAIIERDSTWHYLRNVSLPSEDIVYSEDELGENEGALFMTVDQQVSDYEKVHILFNKGTGTVATDMSKYGNDGILQPDTYWASDMYPCIQATYPAEKGVIIPHDGSMDSPNAFTVSTWVNFLDGGMETIAEKPGAWSVESDGLSLQVTLWSGSSSTQFLDAACPQLYGTWVHLTIVYSGANQELTVRMYFNEVTPVYYRTYDAADGVPAIIDTSLDDITLCWDHSVPPTPEFNILMYEFRLLTIALPETVLQSISFSPYAILGSWHTVVVQGIPSYADFTATDLSNGLYRFTCVDDGTITAWTWDFGDGSPTGSGTLVEHPYALPGEYTVTLSATNSNNVITKVAKVVTYVDAVPPTFGGVQSATPEDCAIQLAWNPATDASQPIIYYVYISTTSPVTDFTTPIAVTQETYVLIEGLMPGQQYFFVVRAKDAAGNVETNTITVSGTPFDASGPNFNGIVNLIKCSNGYIIEWNSATDPSGIGHYNIYMARSSAANFNFAVPSSPPSPVSNTETYCIVYNPDLPSGTGPLFFIVRAVDTLGNEDTNFKWMRYPSGGCPFVGIWNGAGYALENSILPESEIPVRSDLFVTDTYFFRETGILKNNNYSIQISEFENETTTLGSTRLTTVDHPSDFEVISDVDGALVTYTPSELASPATCLESKGNPCLDQILYPDDNYIFEAISGEVITSYFDQIDASNGIRLFVRSDKIPPPHTWWSLELDTYGSIDVDISEIGSDSWVRTGEFQPRNRYEYDVIDLTPFIPEPSIINMKVRLTFNGYHPVDYIGIDVSAQRVGECIVQTMDPVSAEHSRLGDVYNQLIGSDGVVIFPSDQLVIDFPASPTMLSMVRDIALTTTGYYDIPYQVFTGVQVYEQVNINVKVRSTCNNVVEIKIYEGANTIFEKTLILQKGKLKEDTFEFLYDPMQTYSLSLTATERARTTFQFDYIGSDSTTSRRYIILPNIHNIVCDIDKPLALACSLYSDGNGYVVNPSVPVYMQLETAETNYSIGVSSTRWSINDEMILESVSSLFAYTFIQTGLYTLNAVPRYLNNRTVSLDIPIDVKAYDNVLFDLSSIGNNRNEILVGICDNGTRLYTQSFYPCDSDWTVLRVQPGHTYTIELTYSGESQGTSLLTVDMVTNDESIDIVSQFVKSRIFLRADYRYVIPPRTVIMDSFKTRDTTITMTIPIVQALEYLVNT